MPNKTRHLEQYRRNKSLANTNPLNLEENNDWKITLLFYASMHLIESAYADICHNKTHKDRKNFISITKPYNEIIDDYETLESLSRKARYDCMKIKNKEVKIALENMKNIENFINNLN